jgi:NAD(P)H-dependent FMN reductase
MSIGKSIALITTSTRKSRVGPQITNVINEIITGNADATKNTKISLVDVADFNLPVFDEPIMPAMVPSKGSFTQPHSIAWSAEISKYDGYIFVIPEYNHGLAGGTKNAVDFLYNELVGKGAMIVSYGIFGGLQASAQLEGTLKGMKLNVVETRPALAFHGNVGSDLWLAGEGKLGDDTRKDILTATPTILQAFGELKDLVEKQVPRETVQSAA